MPRAGRFDAFRFSGSSRETFRDQITISSPEPSGTLTSADAFPYTVNPIKPKHDQYVIRGKRALFAHHDPRPCLIPPDWSGGYTSIFSLQQEEDAKVASGGMM